MHSDVAQAIEAIKAAGCPIEINGNSHVHEAPILVLGWLAEEVARLRAIVAEAKSV